MEQVRLLHAGTTGPSRGFGDQPQLAEFVAHRMHVGPEGAVYIGQPFSLQAGGLVQMGAKLPQKLIFQEGRKAFWPKT